MNSSNSEGYSYQKSQRMLINPNFKNKKMKDYICPCGRSYGSYPALYSHIKRKHNGIAPGEVIKPKPLRRRGRPFKYELVKLQKQNPHKNASRHLDQYLRNVQKDQSSQFPLKQFAQQDKLRLQFMEVARDQQKLRTIQNHQLIRHNGDIHGLNKANLIKGLNFNEKQRIFPVSRDPSQSQSAFLYNSQRINQRQNETFKTSNQQYEERIPQFMFTDQIQNQHLRNMQNYNHFLSEPAGFLGQMQSHLHPSYDNLIYTNVEPRPNLHPRSQYNVFQSIYSKQFQMALNEQMQEKFRPIAQGITDFLEPILKQMIINEEMQSPQKLVNVDVERLKNDRIEQVEDNEHHKKQDNMDIEGVFRSKQDNRGEMISQCKKRGGQDLNRDDLVIEELLQNQHFRDILKWVMSPPEEVSNRSKENYIQFSFRSCLVQFLEFLNNFLQTAQYEQVLLIVVFFCDHILAVTASFQSRPQPQVYEMSLYFNTFMHQYLPKLINYLPVLSKFYIFVDFKKKTSELLMWLSSWQAMQQYYHNRHYRQKMAFQISQQNYKAILYQKKYQAYITEAFNQNIQHQTTRQSLPNIQNEEVQQKNQDNPELIILSQQPHLINRLNPFDNSSHHQNQPFSDSQLNSEDLKHEQSIHESYNQQVQSSENSLNHSSQELQNQSSEMQEQHFLIQNQLQGHLRRQNLKHLNLNNLASIQIQHQQQQIVQINPIYLQTSNHHNLQQEVSRLQTNNINQTTN